MMKKKQTSKSLGPKKSLDVKIKYYAFMVPKDSFITNIFIRNK
jgi:hypothetical protein